MVHLHARTPFRYDLETLPDSLSIESHLDTLVQSGGKLKQKLQLGKIIQILIGVSFKQVLTAVYEKLTSKALPLAL